MSINAPLVLRGIKNAEEYLAKTKGEHEKKKTDATLKDVKDAEEALEHWENSYIGFTTKQRDAGAIPSPRAWVTIIELGILCALEKTAEAEPVEPETSN